MPTTDLIAALRIAAVTFVPQWRQEYSMQAGGTPRVADIGPPIWMAKLQSSELLNDDAVDAAALVNAMGGSLGTFYVWDVRRQYPRLDPDGSILGSSSVTISAVTATTISLDGLPAGYQIKRGDKLSFDWGSPAHRAFHEFSEDGTANGSGVLPATAVNPPIRTGATVGTAVTLKQPAAEMMIVPGSYDFPSAGPVTSVISLQAVQVP
jgi:hypothetical protein